MNLMTVLGAVHKASPLYWNINTLLVYHIFSGLQSLLGQTGSGSGHTGSEHGSHRLFSSVRLTVPCGELVLVAVEWLQLLCEELIHEGEVCGVVNALCVCIDIGDKFETTISLV